uniref:Uncharacterized protein n=1 Tax=Strombidium rassoulzadegani TaxID=1082188 RepID=A0A7S3FSL8_9SPIT|mmetsp:Transcript_14069/g.23902  ORF Transcript_14069/g.23902 Transcript_14069/m.23902 type:complete len:166 (+) Transcript_14069:16-513(+)
MKYISLPIALGVISLVQGLHQDKLVSTTQKAPNGKWIPEHYSTEEDDQLMKNLIEQGLAYTKDKGFSDNYLFKTEKGCGCNEQSCLCCMQKHTHYWVDKKGALDAATEIVAANLHLQGPKLKGFLDEKFPELWQKYDVINTGWVEVERMSMFYKELMGDWTISIQ